MGVTAPVAEFLLESRLARGELGRTLTLGHQALFVSPRRLRRFLLDNGAWPATLTADDYLGQFTGAVSYADPYLRALGASSVEAMDASPYEGAGVVHDLNEPVGDDLRGRYDTILDGGTLEHVFNFPVALRSCMEMLRPGGRLFVNAVANQNLGHGFYQFSPELFFRALSPRNGFEVVRLHAYEGVLGASRALGFPYEFQIQRRRYELHDPVRHGGRHELLTDLPLGLLVEARKTADVPAVFAPAPQQSDYDATWTDHDAGAPARATAGAAGLKAKVRTRLRPADQTLLWWEVVPRVLWPLDPLRMRRWRRRLSLANREQFRPAPRVLRAPMVRR